MTKYICVNCGTEYLEEEDTYDRWETGVCGRCTPENISLNGTGTTETDHDLI